MADNLFLIKAKSTLLGKSPSVNLLACHLFRRVRVEAQHDIAVLEFMAEVKAYSVRVELLRPRGTSYTRLERDMYKKGFKHLVKGRAGDWVHLPKGNFMISSADTSDNIKRTVVNLANAIDETALVKLAPVLSWAA